MKPTEERLIRALLFDHWRQVFCMPRYTPKNWFECDLFEITKAGFFTEYEIKTSLADFKNDKTKARTEWGEMPGTNLGWGRKLGKTKHQRLADADPLGPSRFFYVAPQGLIKPEQLPLWAGLIECSWFEHAQRFSTQTIVSAPRLHEVKCDQKVIEHAKSVCYYRMHNAFIKNEQLQNDLEKL